MAFGVGRTVQLVSPDPVTDWPDEPVGGGRRASRWLFLPGNPTAQPYSSLVYTALVRFRLSIIPRRLVTFGVSQPSGAYGSRTQQHDVLVRLSLFPLWESHYYELHSGFP